MILIVHEVVTGNEIDVGCGMKRLLKLFRESFSAVSLKSTGKYRRRYPRYITVRSNPVM